jgi:hypothetical protein
MRLVTKDLYEYKPGVRLAESIRPPKRLELLVDMETHILRFVVTKWDEKSYKELSRKTYDALHFAVDDFNGDL